MVFRTSLSLSLLVLVIGPSLSLGATNATKVYYTGSCQGYAVYYIYTDIDVINSIKAQTISAVKRCASQKWEQQSGATWNNSRGTLTADVVFENPHLYTLYEAQASGYVTKECPDGYYYDGANCQLGQAPSGSTAFVYQGSFYYTPEPDCPVPESAYDGANCYMGAPPSGTTPFVYENNLYYTPLPGNNCPKSGSWFDGANCYVASAPAGSDAFIYNGGLYYSPLDTNCTYPGSWFDGANCYVAQVPAGYTPFINLDTWWYVIPKTY